MLCPLTIVKINSATAKEPLSKSSAFQLVSLLGAHILPVGGAFVGGALGLSKTFKAPTRAILCSFSPTFVVESAPAYGI